MRHFWDVHNRAIVSVIVFIIFVGLVFAGLLRYSESQCYAKTESMGFNSRWSFMGDCQIEVNDGQWIPLESYYFKQE